QTVSNGTLKTKACSGSANMRVYVLSTAKTPAPGKIGNDGKYLYDTAAAADVQTGYDGNEEPEDTWTVKDSEVSGPSINEPEVPTKPTMSKGEQAVFFENDVEWPGNIRAWIWSNGTNYTGGNWPGQTATYLGNKIWKWSYTGTAKIPETAGLIFNNGSTQTKDFTYVNGGYYNSNGYVKTIEGAGEIIDVPTPPQPTPDVFTVYFDNSESNWDEVAVYMWDDNGPYVGAWPGTKLTETSTVNGKTYLSYTYTPTAAMVNPMIIFNNNNKGAQTKDLTLVPGGIYTASGLKEVSGINAPAVAEPAQTVIYNLQGIRVNASWNNLPAGIYIVNGKKVAKK
ncbi:MAG: starch-binding protein, partial [Muribaculaceae bacterium]|nr:starch-binding protein [Muribaculaceae bacterium]